MVDLRHLRPSRPFPLRLSPLSHLMHSSSTPLPSLSRQKIGSIIHQVGDAVGVDTTRLSLADSPQSSLGSAPTSGDHPGIDGVDSVASDSMSHLPKKEYMLHAAAKALSVSDLAKAAAGAHGGAHGGTSPSGSGSGSPRASIRESIESSFKPKGDVEDDEDEDEADEAEDASDERSNLTDDNGTHELADAVPVAPVRSHSRQPSTGLSRSASAFGLLSSPSKPKAGGGGGGGGGGSGSGGGEVSEMEGPSTSTRERRITSAPIASIEQVRMAS